MDKPVVRTVEQHGAIAGYWFVCPACGFGHWFRTVPDPNNAKYPVWEFNGDLVKPTFRPSLRLMGDKDEGTKCHLEIADGVITFCNDCPHDLRGQKVPMKPVDET